MQLRKLLFSDKGVEFLFIYLSSRRAFVGHSVFSRPSVH